MNKWEESGYESQQRAAGLTRSAYELQEIGSCLAKQILRDLLAELSQIEPDEMTQLELNLLQRCAVNPPALRYKKEIRS